MEQSLPQPFCIQSADVILLSGTGVLWPCLYPSGALLPRGPLARDIFYLMLCPIACLSFQYMSQPILTPSLVSHSELKCFAQDRMPAIF